MATSDSVFEIREYLDGNGRVSGHDVLDISKELEFMAKLCGEMEQSSQGDVNVGLEVRAAYFTIIYCNNTFIFDVGR